LLLERSTAIQGEARTLPFFGRCLAASPVEHVLPSSASCQMQRSFSIERRRGLFVMAGLLGLCVGAPQAAASDPVTVLLASGRRFTGAIDARSDDAQLWLRVESGPITLLRPIDWDRVRTAQIRDKQLTADELHDQSAMLKSTQPVLERDETGGPPSDGPLHTRNDDSAVGHAQVRAIQIDAVLGHWSATTEATGVVVTLQPLDDHGNLVAIDGVLDVDLIGQRLTVVTEGNGFPQLAHWTTAVRPADFSASGAVYEFPFQAVNPDFHFDLDPHALVHARLNVPGQGSFEASQPMVRIRAYSSVRDHVQQATGSRFLPQEAVGSRQ
jgi:hypothetical protein